MAARRLGGSLLQRTQAAVTSPVIAEERRRLVPRFMHTNEADVMREIQLKKKELYDVLSKAEKDVMTSNWRNRGLLRRLSALVDPIPHDPEWRRLRFSRWASSVVNTAGIITLACMIGTESFSYQDIKDRFAHQKEELLEAIFKRNQ